MGGLDWDPPAWVEDYYRWHLERVDGSCGHPTLVIHLFCRNCGHKIETTVDQLESVERGTSSLTNTCLCGGREGSTLRSPSNPTLPNGELFRSETKE